MKLTYNLFMFPEINKKQYMFLGYIGVGIVLVVSSVFLFLKHKETVSLNARADIFAKMIQAKPSESIQDQKVLLSKEKDDVYRKMTEIYAYLVEDPLYKEHFDKMFDEYVCLLPGFFVGQLICVNLLRKGKQIQPVDIGYIAKYKSPWTSIHELLYLFLNSKNNHKVYTNAALESKNTQELDELINSSNCFMSN